MRSSVKRTLQNCTMNLTGMAVMEMHTKLHECRTLKKRKVLRTLQFSVTAALKLVRLEKCSCEKSFFE